MSTNVSPAKVAETMKRLSAHLDMLAGQIFSVEEALGTLLTSEAERHGVSITKFQSLDFTRQSLEDCALLVHLIGAEESMQSVELQDDSTIERKLKLGSTRGLVAHQTNEIASIDSGDIDFF